MRYAKQALSFTDQINKLESRGLSFNSKTYAEEILSSISYYRLRAYTYSFQDNTTSNHPFNVDISFEEIISLYRFDQKLRILIFNAMEKIEVALRTQIIHQFAVDYGSHWQTDSNLFKTNRNRKGELFFDVHQRTLEIEISRSGETFIEHYQNKYDTPKMPPSWMTLEVVSMGTLSKIYKSLKTCDAKKRVARKFALPNPYILENWMLSFSHLRNICAHHSRLWNRRLTTNIEFPRNPRNPFYSQVDLQNILPYKIFASLLSINYMLKTIDSNSSFNIELKELMQDCPVNEERAMGFPNNWETHNFWS